MATTRTIRFGAISLAAIVVAANARAAEEVFTFDKAHTKVGFRIRHTVSRVEGRFKDFDGTIWLDRENPAQSRVELTIRATSIDTANDNRDGDLRSANFFDVEKFPTITFKSTKVEAAGAGALKVTGDLTMHGVTRPVVLDVEYSGSAKDPWGGVRAGFSARTTIDRKDFGLAYNQLLETGGVLVGETIEIGIEAEMVKQVPAAVPAAA